MSIPKRNIRDLQDIHTHSGRVEETHQPYKAYMKIAALEMEKARRGKERESAIHRVQTIDARFKEIEAEKAAVLQAVDEKSRGNPPIDSRGVEPKVTHGRNTRGFKIRY